MNICTLYNYSQYDVDDDDDDDVDNVVDDDDDDIFSISTYKNHNKLNINILGRGLNHRIQLFI